MEGGGTSRKVNEYLVFTHNHSSPAFNLKSKGVEFDHIEINIEKRGMSWKNGKN